MVLGTLDAPHKVPRHPGLPGEEHQGFPAPYIVYNEQAGACVIVDPGDNAAGIIKTMKEKKVSPEAILLTHGHFDHILAVPELLEEYPDLSVYAYEKEQRLLTDAGLNET